MWTVTAMIPLTYAIWLPEGLRRHAIDGRLLVDGEVVAPVGANLADALAFCLGIFPVLGLTLAVIGAGLGARTTDSRGLVQVLGSAQPSRGDGEGWVGSCSAGHLGLVGAHTRSRVLMARRSSMAL